jgi:nitroreductase
MNSRAALLKEIIDGRRSIRHFSDQPVPADLIRQVVEAGRMAPSPTNTQPWYFLVVSGDDKKEVARLVAADARTVQVEGFKKICLEGVRIINEAPHVITVWNLKHLSRRLKKIRGLVGPRYYKNYERAERDSIACAIENMWLMAHALGLGMVWIMAGLSSLSRFRNEFGIDGEIAAHLALGYPVPANPEERAGRKTLEDVSGFFSKT